MQPNSTLAYLKKTILRALLFVFSASFSFNVWAQTITVKPPLNTFTQNYPSPSYYQVLVITGSTLSSNITAAAPSNYELSLDKVTWSNNVTINVPSANLVATELYIRLNAGTLGSSAGNITLSATGVTSNVAVSGLTILNNLLLEHWPLYAGNTDSAAERAPGIVPTTPTLKNLYLSKGLPTIDIAPAAVPAYSDSVGQAYGASATVEGNWSTTNGGPGGTVRRTYYNQFTITAASGYSVRVDTISFLNAFYQTSSSTRVAIAYSLSGFTTNDSVDVAGATVASPIVVPQWNSGGFVQVTKALNGATGVTLAAGQTLTVRIYNSCSSSGNGRYGLLKDVFFKGAVTNSATPATINTPSLNAFTQILGVPSASQTYSVTASNLLGTLYVAVPNNYEVSQDGINWTNSSTPLGLTPVNGSVNQTVYIRLNATAVGTYAGNIQETSAYTTITIPVTGTTAATPTIFTNSTMTNFTQTIGKTSTVQSYTLFGLNLTNPLTITPPSGYQISLDGSTWFDNANPLVINPAGTSIPTTTIQVRLNAPAINSYAGNIVHSSTGAADVNVAVNGITVDAPTITTVGTLNPFTQIIGTPSAVQTFTVTGSALTNNLIITPPAGFEVSIDGINWFTNANPLVITPNSGSVNTTTVSVRLNTTTAGSYTGSIANATTDGKTINIGVIGTVNPTPVLTITGSLNAFSQTVGTPSAVQTYTISGANLLGNVTITAPAGYEVSLNGTTWISSTSSLTLTPTNGTLANTTISVRLNSTTASTYAGNIINATSGINNKNIPVTGVSVPAPVITTSVSTLTGFIQTLGTPTAGKKYTVSGTNLTAPVIVTPPAGYEISKDSITWTNSAISLAPTSGTLAATAIFVRLNATTAGNYNVSITHTSAGAATKSVALTGTVPGLTAVTNIPGFFQANVAAPSTVYAFTLQGNFLTGNVTITPPDKYQVSIDSGKTWVFTPVTVTPVNNSVNMQVYLRLFSGFTGTYNGNIVVASPNTNAIVIPVKGVTTTSQAYSAYPVPSINMVYLTHPSNTSPATITIFNAAGQKVTTFAAQSGASETPLDISHWPGGIYSALYETGATRQVIRFIKR